MKVSTPEISWHNRLPALALDVIGPVDKKYRVATGGTDCRVYIWIIELTAPSAEPQIKIRAGLRRHQKSIGAVRFSCQQILASGDDDGYIYIWKQQDLEPEPSDPGSSFINDDGFEDLESWQQLKVLRGHVEDICDLAWSKDGQVLLSGSVDNSAILWDPFKGCKIWCSDLIKGYVQGVAIDPHSRYMVTHSLDRTLRIYNFIDKRNLLYATRRMKIQGKYKAFFGDDTVQTFCRRLEFSPDGQYLVAPTCRMVEVEQTEEKVEAGRAEKKLEVVQIDELKVEQTEEKQGDGKLEEVKILNTSSSSLKKPTKNVFLIFKRNSFQKPAFFYPTGKEMALCARFSPVIYSLRKYETNLWSLPYRLVFAVATSRSVLIYDSQQSAPIGYVSQIHLARLTDLSWSNDGQLLMISSYDGYSTLITFDKDEFGEKYDGLMIEPTEDDKTADISTGEKPTKLKKGKKRLKVETEGEVAPKKEKLDGEDEPDKDDSKDDSPPSKQPKRLKPKKIESTKLPEKATMWAYVVKKN